MRWRKVLTGLVSAACVALAAGVMTAGPARADAAPTQSSLTQSTDTVFFGVGAQDELTIDVTGGDGSPAGTWGVFTGQTLVCGGTVTNGVGTCFLAAQALAPGSYSLTAIYFGDENSGESVTNSVDLTVVAQQPTTTTLTLSAPTIIFGQETSEHLTVRVSPLVANIPTGTVTITAGSQTVCTIPLDTLDLGTNSCFLSAEALPADSYQLTASYTSDGGSFADSASAPQALTVVPPQPTTTALTLTSQLLVFGREQTETLTVEVASAGIIGNLTGFATITAVSTLTGRATTVCTLTTLLTGIGSCTLTASQLNSGSYQLTASYSGDQAFNPSTSASETLRIVRIAPS